jgi:hypothetical protein
MLFLNPSQAGPVRRWAYIILRDVRIAPCLHSLARKPGSQFGHGDYDTATAVTQADVRQFSSLDHCPHRTLGNRYRLGGRRHGQGQLGRTLRRWGLPLIRRRLENGKFHHGDAIKSSFDRLLRKVGLNGGRGFYCLRKTGATLIEQIDPAATEMYLGHAENGMKRVYAQRDWGRLEKALLVVEERLKEVLVQEA